MELVFPHRCQGDRADRRCSGDQCVLFVVPGIVWNIKLAVHRRDQASEVSETPEARLFQTAPPWNPLFAQGVLSYNSAYPPALFYGPSKVHLPLEYKNQHREA
jgi:hypothetical protein